MNKEDDTFLFLKYGWSRNEWPSKEFFQKLQESDYGKWVMLEWAININYAHQQKSIEESYDYIADLHVVDPPKTLSFFVQYSLSNDTCPFTKNEILGDLYKLLLLANEIENG